MFKNKFLTLLVGFMVISSIAHAEMSYSMPALEFGMKMNSADLQGATSNKQAQSFQGGGSMVIDFGSGNDRDFGLKVGLMYSERGFKNEISGATVEGKITYAEIPAHLMFKFEDYAGIYLGPSFAIKMSDDCEISTGGTCSLTNVKSSITPITFGAQFKVAANFGLSLFFETVSGEIAQGYDGSRGIGANLLFVFD